MTSIDASAAEQLRMAVKRVSEHGCKETCQLVKHYLWVLYGFIWFYHVFINLGFPQTNEHS